MGFIMLPTPIQQLFADFRLSLAFFVFFRVTPKINPIYLSGKNKPNPKGIFFFWRYTAIWCFSSHKQLTPKNKLSQTFVAKPENEKETLLVSENLHLSEIPLCLCVRPLSFTLTRGCPKALLRLAVTQQGGAYIPQAALACSPDNALPACQDIHAKAYTARPILPCCAYYPVRSSSVR
jgi:hypothetical protein